MSMRNSWKIAKWEIRRNLKNKSFLISLFITPIIFIIFFTIPQLFSGGEEADSKVYIYDEIGLWEELQPLVDQEGYLNWDVEVTTENLESFKDILVEEEDRDRKSVV